MRIVHIREISNVAATLVEGLRRLGHEVDFWPMQIRRNEASLLSRAMLTPARLREVQNVQRSVRMGNYEAVHIHWAYMGWLGILGGYPYFLHCHGSDLRRNLGWPFLGWATRRALRRSRRVFYSTPDLKPYATGAKPDAAFIPNPINTDVFRPLPPPELNGVKILMMSRFETVKGPEKATAIVRELKRLNRSVTVDALNWGVDARRYADPAVMQLIPTVPYTEMPKLLSHYDIVIGQMKLGILSMSELEAMSCGKPVLCEFQYPEVYAEAPPVLSSSDVKQAATALAELAEDRELRSQLGEKGREWVEKYHHYVKVAELVQGHYLTD